jgi:hypothetical protein
MKELTGTLRKQDDSSSGPRGICPNENSKSPASDHHRRDNSNGIGNITTTKGGRAWIA